MEQGKKKRAVKAGILSNEKIAPDHFIMKVVSEHLARTARPGNFVNVRVREETTDPLLSIPLGIHEIHGEGISLLYKVVGKATRILSGREKAEDITLLGPLGNGFDAGQLSAAEAPRAILVAGGHGIAPLFALAVSILEKKIPVDLYAGAGTASHLVRLEDLEKMGARTFAATDDGSLGTKGHVTELLMREIGKDPPPREGTVIFACGPRPMAAALCRIHAETGIPAQISLDAYMACGIGACLGCAVRTRDSYSMVCKDGPVFNACDIDEERL